MGGPNPTLNIVEGCLGEDEGLEWDTSDLREIPEEMEDWGGWNSPEEYEENWLLPAPSEIYYSDDSLGYETNTEQYSEDLQLMLQRTPGRYQSTWIQGSLPREEMRL